MKQWNQAVKEKTPTIKVADKSYLPCILCDKNGLVSMLEIRTNTRDEHGKPGHDSTYFYFTLDDSIIMHKELEEGQRICHTSMSCRCDRGRDYYEARDKQPAMLDLKQYNEALKTQQDLNNRSVDIKKVIRDYRNFSSDLREVEI